jgi:hypothetical protein
LLEVQLFEVEAHERSVLATRREGEKNGAAGERVVLRGQG